MIMRRLALVGVWVALWGDVSAANVLWGFIISFVLTWLVPDRSRSGVRIHIVGALRLTGYMLVNLITSSVAVIRAVVRPTPDRTVAEIVSVPLVTSSPVVASVVANSITMTPGTMTVSATSDPMVLEIHVLGRVDVDDFRRRVAHLETLVARALSMDVTP